MILGPVLYTELTDGAVGALVSDRVYPMVLPQQPTMPAISYQQISNPVASEGTLELRQPRFQFNCFADTAIAARALANALVGQMRGWSSKSDSVIHANDEGWIDDYDDDAETYRVIIDIVFSVCD